MPSTLHQKLYLGGLAPGLNMTITEVEPSVPSDEKWGVNFGRYDVGFKGINLYGPHDNLTLPYTVATSTLGGLIGEATFDGYSGLYDTGTGGKVDITVRIHGTTNVKGKDYTVDQKGYISVSTTEWLGLERPDYTNVSYYWGDSPPVVLSISVPPSISGQPDDAYFVFGLGDDGKAIGVNTSLHKEIIDKALDYVIRGIFWVNEKLAGWATGEVIPL